MRDKISPEKIFDEYKKATDFKASLGEKGLFEQSKMNERFYVGDQWHGARVGNSRPLVRRNFIKRIGEYKISAIGAAPVAVTYSADGIPDTADMQEQKDKVRAQMMSENGLAEMPGTVPDAAETSVIMEALSQYQKTTAERVKFNAKCEETLRRAYISGTGFLHTYWDAQIVTGLYADEAQTAPIKGDIACEVIDAENICFADPNNDSVQAQPWIIISSRRPVEDVKREAKKNGQSTDEIEPDKDDFYTVNAGTYGESEPTDSRRCTVLTKIWKEYEEDGVRVKAARVTEHAIVREEWDMQITLYPIARLPWERRRSCIYGESEITYLIPNQIAVNRALSAEISSAMATGMPKTIVDQDLLGDQEITNDPGEILKIAAGGTGVQGAIMHLQPTAYASQFETLIGNLVANTLQDCGANDAALGNVRPDNAAAIVQIREAAMQPMQLYQNRYYDFIEDTARIWAEFWIKCYGDRALRVKDKDGVHYVPFHAERYRNLAITARVDVGASTMYSEAASINSLSNLLASGVIDPVQYLERLPKGLIPKVNELLDEKRKEMQAAREQQEIESGNDPEMMQAFAEQYPEEYSLYQQMEPGQRQALVDQLFGRRKEEKL